LKDPGAMRLDFFPLPNPAKLKPKRQC